MSPRVMPLFFYMIHLGATSTSTSTPPHHHQAHYFTLVYSASTFRPDFLFGYPFLCLIETTVSLMPSLFDGTGWYFFDVPLLMDLSTQWTSFLSYQNLSFIDTFHVDETDAFGESILRSIKPIVCSTFIFHLSATWHPSIGSGVYN